MTKKIKYTSAESFMFVCAHARVMPIIRWYEDAETGFIYFKPDSYVVEKGEAHVFYSDDKKLLDAIWNSIGLIKRAVKLVEEVKE